MNVGDEVNIINSTMSGVYRLEGRAVLKRLIDAEDSRWLVRFRDGTVERFVDPAAQGADVAAYIGRLNDPPRGGSGERHD